MCHPNPRNTDRGSGNSPQPRRARRRRTVSHSLRAGGRRHSRARTTLTKTMIITGRSHDRLRGGGHGAPTGSHQPSGNLPQRLAHSEQPVTKSSRLFTSDCSRLGKPAEVSHFQPVAPRPPLRSSSCCGTRSTPGHQRYTRSDPLVTLLRPRFSDQGRTPAGTGGQPRGNRHGDRTGCRDWNGASPGEGRPHFLHARNDPVQRPTTASRHRVRPTRSAYALRCARFLPKHECTPLVKKQASFVRTSNEAHPKSTDMTSRRRAPVIGTLFR